METENITTNTDTTIQEVRILQVKRYDERTGYIVLRMQIVDLKAKGKKTFIASGFMSILSVNLGAFYTLDGVWSYDRGIKVFRFNTISVVLPRSRDMVVKFLTYKGFCPGLPAKTANAIVEALGEEALYEIENNPTCLENIKGVGPTWRKRIPKAIKESRNAETVFCELYTSGIRSDGIMALYTKYRDETLQKIYSNPYEIAHEIPDACPFVVADGIAWKHELDPYSIFRARAGVIEALRQAVQNGFTFLNITELTYSSIEILKTKPDLSYAPGVELDAAKIGVAVYDAIPILVNEGNIVLTRVDGVDSYYLPLYRNAEELVTQKLFDIASSVKEIEQFPPRQKPANIRYSSEQLQAIKMALSSHFCVITGGPGTGKTTVMAEIVRRHLEADRNVLLAAPTAKAADRMKEVTGLEAKTIHRLLGFKPFGDAFFNHDRPLEADVIIVDEFSMVDILLMKDLVDAIQTGTILIAIGDVDQLPSVGAGFVLGDIISSGAFPVVRLSTTFRQSSSSGIPRIAAEINNCKIPKENKDNPELILDWRKGDDSVSNDAVISAITSFQHKCFFNPEDIRVMTPLREGDTGSSNYSRVLRPFYNKNWENCSKIDFGVGGEFYHGDRVMQNVNSYRMGVMNGEEGFIHDIDTAERTIDVFFPTLGDVITYNEQDVIEGRLEPSYAITVHKSQGSEYKGVFLILPPEASVMISKRLLYTAVTRAKEAVYIFGSKYVMEYGLNPMSEQKRNSGLKALLIEKKRELFPTDQDLKEQNRIGIESDELQDSLFSLDPNEFIFFDEETETDFENKNRSWLEPTEYNGDTNRSAEDINQLLGKILG